METRHVHARNSRWKSDEGPHHGQQARQEDGAFAGAGKEAVCDVQVAMGDGTVRLVSAGISTRTWGNALRPDDGEVLGPDW